MKKATKRQAARKQPSRNGARPCLSEPELEEFKRRWRAVEQAKTTLQMLNESYVTFTSVMKDRYHVAGPCDIDFNTGELRARK